MTITVDEYFSSSYRPDLEYVDGVLVKRGTPTIAHGLLQALLVGHFAIYRKQFRFAVLTNVRTQIIERARYRVPDVMLCPVPLPTGKIVDTAPWVVLEVLPDDRMPRQLERFRDYQRVGVRHTVLLDPDELLAFRFENGSLLPTQFTSLDLPTGTVPFDTSALFQQLMDKRNEGRTSPDPRP